MKAQFDFGGNVVLVTGGASGLGRALVEGAAAAGATVVVADVDDAAGKEMAGPRPGGGEVEYVHLDVTDHAEVDRVVADVAARHGRIDGLVCSAAIEPLATVAEMSPEHWLTVMDVNVNGTVWACRAVLPTMIAQQRGSIIVYHSGTAEQGKENASAYTTSKAAVRTFAKSLAREVAQHHVRVNVFRPGAMDTPLFRKANPNGAPGAVDQPRDVVGPLMFLLSDAATMTGSSVLREMAYTSPA
ncbi:SDR family NAD(P)-dependent oxidoreductase [Pseudonocardia pini]|uniref:SDR family NAD(P)-dependent oxidoreductase n=1 Tax=Pseudonocardia pini TaxID=2758030 RepID=UPI0015F036EA|nr:SDR family NAD(P)-dependent oxidoreductase [Pseudonocardia pini]